MEKIEKTETTSTESKLTKPEKGEANVIHKTFKSYLLSRKLWATIFSLILLWVMYWRQVEYLYSFATYPDQMAGVLIPAFLALTRDVMVCFTAVIGAFLGIQGLVQWKHGTESVISHATEFIQEKRDENVNIKEERTEKVEYTEHVDDSVPNQNLREFQDE